MEIDLPHLEFDKLPVEFTFPGLNHIRVRVETYSEKHWSMLYHHVQESVNNGSGLSEGTLMSVGERYEEGKPGYGHIVFLNASDRDFIAAMGVGPTNMCRGENPLYSKGFIVVNKAYRGQKIAFHIMKMYPVFARHYGYQGSLSKAAIVARSLVPSMRSGARHVGMIPWSIQLNHFGWCHDIIWHGTYVGSNDLVPEKVSFPALCSREVLEASHPVFKRPAPTHNLLIIRHKEFGNLKISPADKDELWEVQHILRDCAQEGDGFGLDEFTNDGVFNEKLIGKCCYWVVRREMDGNILAVVMTGEAIHPRSQRKEMVNGVIVVLKSFRRQGLASQLLQFCEDHCQKLGFQHILTDVLASNQEGLGLMEKHGFLVTGTVPNSCIISRRGKFVYVNSNIYWKRLVSGPPSAKI